MQDKVQLSDRICPMCGSAFITHGEDWVYKIKDKKVKYSTKFLCSWHCLREYEKTGVVKRKYGN